MWAERPCLFYAASTDYSDRGKKEKGGRWRNTRSKMGVLLLIICSNLVKQEAEVIVAHPEQILEGDRVSVLTRAPDDGMLLTAGDPCFLHPFFFSAALLPNTCTKKSLLLLSHEFKLILSAMLSEKGCQNWQEIAWSIAKCSTSSSSISFPLISALYIHPGDPPTVVLPLESVESNETRMRQSRELIISDWSISVW